MCSCGLADPTWTTAWDMAFYNIEIVDTLFVEDDAIGSTSFYEAFFNKTFNTEYVGCNVIAKSDDPDWTWWHQYKSVGRELKCFNPFCVLKKSLIEKVLEFRKANESFMFHEMLFASLAGSYTDLKKYPDFDLTQFRYRPKVRMVDIKNFNNVMVHPFKDDKVSMVALM